MERRRILLVDDNPNDVELALNALQDREAEVEVAASGPEALAALRRTGSHLGIAIDEAGTITGVVALEDLVEEYVGTVRDGTHVAGAAAV